MKQLLISSLLILLSGVTFAQTYALSRGGDRSFRIINEKTISIPLVKEKGFNQQKDIYRVIEHDGYYDCYFSCIDKDTRTAGDIKTPHYREVYRVSIESGEVLAPVTRVFKEPENEAPFYEDANWICQTCDHGEFGAYTWLIEKATGKEFLYELDTRSINSVESAYLITTPLALYRIASPAVGVPCQDKTRFEEREDVSLECYGNLPLNEPELIYQIPVQNYIQDSDALIDYEDEPAIPCFVSSLFLDNEYYIIRKDNRSFIGQIVNQQIKKVYQFPFLLSKASSRNDTQLYIRNGLKGMGFVVINGYDITLYNIEFVPLSK